MAPEPPPFQEASHCFVCKSTFTTFRRRHHCRCCGKSVCADHSSHSKNLPQFGLNFPVRVCDDCYGQPPMTSRSQKSFQDPLGASAFDVKVKPSDVSQPIEEGHRLTSDENTLVAQPEDEDESHSLEPKFECTCGMPLCICEAPRVIQEPPRAPVAFEPSPEPAPRESQQKKAAASASRPTPSSSNGLPSLFFTGGSKSNSTGSQKSTQNYEATDEGLREAVRNGDAAAVKRLLAQGVSPHYVDRQGMPLLHLAAVFNQTEIVFILLDAGANPESRSAQGETAFDCAPATLAHKMKEKLNAS